VAFQSCVAKSRDTYGCGETRKQFTLVKDEWELVLDEGLVKYLAARIADQQQVIVNLITVDSEQRLGKTLLQLARTLGKKCQQSTRIELKISHDELSEIVGTTRPRISLFMQRFRNLGLIETNLDRLLVINEKKLTDYLARTAITAGHHRGSRAETRPVIRQRLFSKLVECHVKSIGR